MDNIDKILIVATVITFFIAVGFIIWAKQAELPEECHYNQYRSGHRPTLTCE